MLVFFSTFALGFGGKCNKQANYSVEKCNIYRKYAHALEGYVGEILLVGVNYDKKTKIHECAIERIQINGPLKTKNEPHKKRKGNRVKETDRNIGANEYQYFQRGVGRATEHKRIYHKARNESTRIRMSEALCQWIL